MCVGESGTAEKVSRAMGCSVVLPVVVGFHKVGGLTVPKAGVVWLHSE